MEASLDQIKKTKKPTQNDAVRGNEGVETLRVWDCGSPLYDVHELVSVSFIIEKHLMLLPGASDSKRFKAHLRAPAHKVAKAVTVVGSEIIDGCGGGRGGGCGWMLVKKWRCNKKVSKYKLKKSFARLI